MRTALVFLRARSSGWGCRSPRPCTRDVPTCDGGSTRRGLVMGPTVRALCSQRESCDCETPTSFESLIAEIASGDDIRCTIFALKLSV